MSKINFTLAVSIEEAKTAIKTVGHLITPIIVSEPGVGKSTLLNMLAEDNGDAWRKPGDVCPDDKYDYVYVDCPVKDMMDVAASIPNHESKTLEYYVSSLFKLGNGKKKVIMLDEFMKSPKLLQIIFTRLILERTVGDEPLPDGSIVFATSNNSSDGVGDSMLAHVGNRVTVLKMSKPNAEQWNVWATANKVARPIRAWAAMNPRAFYSYTDGGQEDNPFIFKPSGTAQQFVSPRSLATASNIVRSRKHNDPDAVIAALTGALGESGARDMQAYIEFADQLPTWEATIDNPKTTKVPTSPGACAIVVFGAISRITKDTITPFMEYLERFDAEWQAVFAINIAKAKDKQAIAFSSKSFSNWVAKNQDLL